ncbi:uncharacterized protein [Diabrotica undecimpunctata]|uniref:uncharacterized protein n=1 Tax=Diabrotica undecimpunctata TaxID=50387 RepID=UPI003B63D673
MAAKRFSSLEGTFLRNPSLKTDYTKVINEYLHLSHADIVPKMLQNDLGNNAYFLPHFAVVKDSGSSKTRVVFDASARTSTGLSLNDVLFTGPQVQPNLYNIVLRLRSFRFVLTADIQKMYRQIHVNPKHQFVLNFLWRDNPQDKLQSVQRNRLVFGTMPAPYLATRVLNHLAEVNKEKYPFAYDALTSQTYIDDILSGCNDETHLRILFQQLNEVLTSAKFSLHKYTSNSLQFLRSLSIDSTAIEEVDMDPSTSKLLGLKWSPFDDCFFFTSPTIKVSGAVTRRVILSIVAKCFDPVGFLSPVILLGKLLVQKVWTLRVGWDDPVTDITVLTEWNTFLKELYNM